MKFLKMMLKLLLGAFLGVVIYGLVNQCPNIAVWSDKRHGCDIKVGGGY